MSHQSVLLQEVCEGLRPMPENIVVDATVASGGHAVILGQGLSSEGTLVGIDRDEDALKQARKRLGGLACRVHLVHDNYRNIEKIAEHLSLSHIDRLFIDLGMSIEQLEISGRGFSFLRNEPLLMTFEKEPNGITAKDIVNDWGEEVLSDLLYGYGEEQFAKKIAKAIIKRRKEKEIKMTLDLIAIISTAVPSWYKRKRIHFATKTFQALRIAVNDEVESLKIGLAKGLELLGHGGKVGVITFESIEDRIVKNMFRDNQRLGLGMVINKKPIVPQREEIQANPRSRSAKLRIFEKV